MKRFTRQLTLILLTGLLVTGFTTGFTATTPTPDKKSAAPLKPLVLGIFPRRGATNTMKMFQPLTDYLSQQLGRPVKLVTARDFSAFWDGVVNQRYDIVHYNQLHYIESHKEYGYKVILANEEFGVKTICGVIMVRTDEGIDELSDLKGKRIIFGGGRKAMISYVATTAMLRDAGLQDGDYQELFAKNPPNASLAAYHHQSDAAGVGSPVLKMPSIKAAIDTSKIRFLAESRPLVHLPWAVNKRLGKEMARKVTHAMLDLNNTEQGHKILTSAKLTGLYKVTDKDFNPHRRLIEKITR